LQNYIIHPSSNFLIIISRSRTSYVTSLKKFYDPTANENTIIQASAKKESQREMARISIVLSLMLTINILTLLLTSIAKISLVLNSHAN